MRRIGMHFERHLFTELHVFQKKIRESQNWPIKTYFGTNLQLKMKFSFMDSLKVNSLSNVLQGKICP